MPRTTWARCLWLVAYLATMAMVAGSLSRARQWTISNLSQPAATVEWQAWKDDVATAAPATGPVKRRPPKSDEPPGLVLLRDNFPVVLGSSLLIVSFLFGFMMFALLGMARSAGDRRPSPAEGSRD